MITSVTAYTPYYARTVGGKDEYHEGDDVDESSSSSSSSSSLLRGDGDHESGLAAESDSINEREGESGGSKDINDVSLQGTLNSYTAINYRVTTPNQVGSYLIISTTTP